MIVVVAEKQILRCDMVAIIYRLCNEVRDVIRVIIVRCVHCVPQCRDFVSMCRFCFDYNELLRSCCVSWWPLLLLLLLLLLLFLNSLLSRCCCCCCCCCLQRNGQSAGTDGPLVSLQQLKSVRLKRAHTVSEDLKPGR